MSQDEFRYETASDKTISGIVNCTQPGKCYQFKGTYYYKIKDALSISNGILVKGKRTVITKLLQSRILNHIH